MTRSIILGIIIVVAVVAILAGVKIAQFKKMGAMAALMAPPPESISSAVTHHEKWAETLPAIGSATPAEGVMVSPEIAGTINELDFESGAFVKQGDLLVRLNSSSEEAQLRAAEAQVELARLNLERSRKLVANQTISQSELDAAEAALKQNQANADSIRATIDKKTIRAPFSGRLGIRLVNLGEQLDVGKSIVSLQSLSPMYVDFALPQQDLSELVTGLVVNVTTDAYPGKKFQGEVAAINPDLDSVTRNVQLRARFENTNGLLRAGMFVRAEVVLPAQEPALVIPSTALFSAPYGDSVFVIMTATAAGMTNLAGTNLVVQQKFIRTGRSHGDFVSVEDGLKDGDLVATAGIFKLRSGTAIIVNNSVVPNSSENPVLPNK